MPALPPPGGGGRAATPAAETAYDTPVISLATPVWMGVAALLGAGSAKPAATRDQSTLLGAVQAAVVGAPLIAVATGAATPAASLLVGLAVLLTLAAGTWHAWGRWRQAGGDGESTPHLPALAAARRWHRAATVTVAVVGLSASRFPHAFPHGFARRLTCPPSSSGLALLDAGLGVAVAAAGEAAGVSWHAPTLAPAVTVPAAFQRWVVPPGPPPAAVLAKAAVLTACMHGVALATGALDPQRAPTFFLKHHAAAAALSEALALWSLHAAAAALARWHAGVEERRRDASSYRPPSFTVAALARSGRSAVAVLGLGAAAVVAGRVAPPCRETANPTYLLACLALHEAAAGACSAVLGLVTAATGKSAVSFPYVTHLDGVGGLAAALVAATPPLSTGVEWVAAPHSAGPGKARVWCGVRFGVAVSVAGAWRELGLCGGGARGQATAAAQAEDEGGG